MVTFQASKQAGADLQVHVDAWRDLHRDLIAMYWTGTEPDYKKIVTEMFTVLFIRSLDTNLYELVITDMKTRARDDFTFANAIASALADRKFKKAMGGESSSKTNDAEVTIAGLARAQEDLIFNN